MTKALSTRTEDFLVVVEGGSIMVALEQSMDAQEDRSSTQANPYSAKTERKLRAAWIEGYLYSALLTPLH